MCQSKGKRLIPGYPSRNQFFLTVCIFVGSQRNDSIPVFQLSPKVNALIRLSRMWNSHSLSFHRSDVWLFDLVLYVGWLSGPFLNSKLNRWLSCKLHSFLTNTNFTFLSVVKCKGREWRFNYILVKKLLNVEKSRQYRVTNCEGFWLHI